MKCSEAVAQVLKVEGVEFITCFPLNPIIDAAAALNIRPLVTRHERVAVNMADGYSRMTGGRKIGVAVVQYGAGSESAFAGVAQAYGDSTPLLVLAGATESASLSVPPNFQASRNYRHITKWSETVTDPTRVVQMMQHAFALLRSGKSGPVLLEFPSDIMDAEFPGGFAYTPQRRHSPAGGERDIDEAADRHEALRHPSAHRPLRRRGGSARRMQRADRKQRRDRGGDPARHCRHRGGESRLPGDHHRRRVGFPLLRSRFRATGRGFPVRKQSGKGFAGCAPGQAADPEKHHFTMERP
ncbi:MAG: thiamine pyrophosphate-binding protein [Thermodesulfobacteriota bacterium]